MLKLILRNLWARRRRNGWLLAELVLVSVISWVILDPVIVLMHDRSIPIGYDSDRLCIVSLGALQPNAPGYDAGAQDSARLVDGYYQLVRLAKNFEGVELATPLLGFCYPNSSGSGNANLTAEGDTVSHQVMWMQFLPHTQFFETYGFRPGMGRTPEQLSDYDYAKNDLVLTENAAYDIFGRRDVQGERCESTSRGDTVYQPVIGVVETFKSYSDWRPMAVAFFPTLNVDANDIPQYAQILIRIKEGVSMKRFLHDFRPWMLKELRQGNLFARSARSYDDLITEREAGSSTPVYRRNLAMALFFLVNLCLGVIGTFWLQTRTRCEEVGVMLAFGATPGRIVRLLLGEGAVLTLLASLAGFVLYLQYALKEGLYNGLGWGNSAVTAWASNFNQKGVEPLETYWVSNFAQHFCIVSLIILLILLAVVLVGIFIPARNISRIPPTEALRDE